MTLPRRVVLMSNTLTHTHRKMRQQLHQAILTHVPRPRHRPIKARPNVKVDQVAITALIALQLLEVDPVAIATAQHQLDVFQAEPLIDTHTSVSKL